VLIGHDPEPHYHLPYCLPAPGMEEGEVDQVQKNKTQEENKYIRGEGGENNRQVKGYYSLKQTFGQNENQEYMGCCQKGKINGQCHCPGTETCNVRNNGSRHQPGEILSAFKARYTSGTGNLSLQHKHGATLPRVSQTGAHLWGLTTPGGGYLFFIVKVEIDVITAG
jgi:hypothetical protein